MSLSANSLLEFAFFVILELYLLVANEFCVQFICKDSIYDSMNIDKY